jgi:hypothetical protein
MIKMLADSNLKTDFTSESSVGSRIFAGSGKQGNTESNALQRYTNKSINSQPSLKMLADSNVKTESVDEKVH